jgi:hypothetical protein
MIISGSYDYEFHCSLYDLELVKTRWITWIANFHFKILQSADCLNKLLRRREMEYIKSSELLIHRISITSLAAFKNVYILTLFVNLSH